MTERFLLSVDPYRIRFNPLNPRKHQGFELDRLRKSIQRYGILQPPIVRSLPGNLFEAVDGEGRTFIAIELGLKQIQVINIGSVGADEALLLLQVSNSVRNFNFLAECKGFANLHRQERSMKDLAEEFGYKEAKMQDMVHIGYLPDDIQTPIQEHMAVAEDHARVWTQSLLTSMLVLCELYPGQTFRHGNGWFSLDRMYDYTEVRIAVQQVISRKITTFEEMKTYVAQRRYEIFQARFDAVLEQKLQEELTLAREELAVAKQKGQAELEAVKDEEILTATTQLREQYEGQILTLEAQVESLTKSRQKTMNAVAKQPEHIEQQEQKLREEIQETQIARKELNLLRQRVEEEARQIREKRESEERQDKQRWEATKRQMLEADLFAQREKQEQRLRQAEQELEAMYVQKDQENQIKAENTIRGLLSHGIQHLAETQQIIDHIVSSAMLQPVRELGGAHHESLLWAIRSLSEALGQAEKKLVDGDVSTYVEGGMVNGYQQTASEHFSRESVQ